MYPPTRQGSALHIVAPVGPRLLSWRAEVELCEAGAAEARRRAAEGEANKSLAEGCVFPSGPGLWL